MWIVSGIKKVSQAINYFFNHVDIFLLCLVAAIILVFMQQKSDDMIKLVPNPLMIEATSCTNSNHLHHNGLHVVKTVCQVVDPEKNPSFSAESIPQPRNLLSAHSATIEMLDNNDLIALWFAGSREGATDVQIWQSYYHNGAWQMAHPVLSPLDLSFKLHMLVRKVGNPVIYKAQNGVLHLFVVSVTLGGWAGSRLNHLVSIDNGKGWQIKSEMVLSPFLNMSNLDRTSAITLSDGGFYLPVYHELIFTYPELLRFAANGNFIDKVRMNSAGYLLQPAMVANSSESAIILLRNKAVKNNVLYQQSSNDAGVSWSGLKQTNLTNSDSSVAADKLTATDFIMIHNQGKRNKLVLALSKDSLHWQDVAMLENESYGEFSYPSMKIHGDTVDVLYTWKRKYIKHVRFNLAWLIKEAREKNYVIGWQ